MMNATLNQLRAFLAIVRGGSFQAAAQELHLSQPSISQRVRELEAELGTRLFVRRGPRISLTAEAHALMVYAERMVSTAQEMGERFGSRNPLRGTLRIGMSENFALLALGELLRRLEQRYPAIRTLLFVGDSGQLSAKLNACELDIGIVAEPGLEPHVAQQPAGYSLLGWFAHPGFRPTRDVLSPADLAHDHLMIAPPGSRQHSTIGQWFSHAGVTPARISTCNNVGVTLLAVQHGAAIGLLPLRVVRDELAAGTVRLLRVSPEIPAHRISLCYQTSEMGEGLLELVELLGTVINDFEVFAARPSTTRRGMQSTEKE
ncbi:MULTISPECIES: LysR family transcriptional regulator [unclassified Variovorax]|uniref:LysR family transcriptional regulator n=1 Tax=unclassified Variovorax TaxID=663243 RepID=UPI00210CAF7D|nr:MULTISPECIES: LysR family transcriptional regulator [unclassified Variovorax]